MYQNMNEVNPLPDIETYSENMNPIINSPSAIYSISFYQTKDTLSDPETYRSFLKNIESRFRHSTFYTEYKKSLYDIGLDRCQILGYITKDMAKLEMHHAILNLFDLTLILTEYLLNTVGYVTTYDVVKLLKKEHSEYNIPLVMMTLTPHELYHNEQTFFIHPDMCFGKWPVFIERYKLGMTQDICFKLLHYLKKAIKEDGTDDGGLLDLREKIKEWSNMVC